jgi:DNA repair exonuclease SbcCD ATPase subunit
MKNVLTLLLASLLLQACASTPPSDENLSRQAAAQAEAEAAARAAAQEQLVRRARELAEQQAREAAEADRRYLELEAQLREEEQARRRAQAAANAPSGQTAVPAGSRPATGASSSQQREQAVTQQQARIAELRALIAANKAETSRVDAANEALREAIAAAEELTAMLAAEQAKYTGADPATGQTQGSLSKLELDELGAEVARLRALAAELATARNSP